MIDFEKKNNQEIVELLKEFEVKYDELKVQCNTLFALMEAIDIEYQKGEEILKKRLGVK